MKSSWSFTFAMKAPIHIEVMMGFREFLKSNLSLANDKRVR